MMAARSEVGVAPEEAMGAALEERGKEDVGGVLPEESLRCLGCGLSNVYDRERFLFAGATCCESRRSEG